MEHETMNHIYDSLKEITGVSKSLSDLQDRLQGEMIEIKLSVIDRDTPNIGIFMRRLSEVQRLLSKFEQQRSLLSKTVSGLYLDLNKVRGIK